MELKLVSSIDPDKMLVGPRDVVIDVGYFNEEHHSGLTDADLAEYLSDGDYTIGMPPRPHLLEGLEAGAGRLDEAFAALVPKLIEGKDSGSGIEAIGQIAVDCVRQYIDSGELAPNAPSRIEEKGSDRPLIDTGELVRLITFEVERGNDG